MRRTSNFLIGVGLFLLISLLWPYDPEDPAASKGLVMKRTWTSTMPIGFELIKPVDEWGDEVTRTIYDAPFSFAVATGYREKVLTIAPGVRVPPGTHWINVTAETSALDGTRPIMDLWFTTSNDVQRLLQLHHEETVATRVADEWADWAPDPDTRWRFLLATSEPGYVNGRLRIEISRDGPLAAPQFVPDRWNGKDSVRVFEQRAVLWDMNPTGQQSSSLAGGSQPNSAPRLRLQPATGVEQLVVLLRYNSSTPTDFHYRPLLDYRGADREDSWERVALDPYDAKEATRDGYYAWKLPVEPRMWDSPFADHTRWQVRVNWHGNSPQTPTLMNGDFQFSIDARRDPPRA